MKELSFEQKAKAYDELFVKAKQIYNKENDVLILHTIEDLFPELKESDDERIRKALIRFHKSTIDIDGIKGEDILAWLEKQDKQKPTDEVEPKFKRGDRVRNKKSGLEQTLGSCIKDVYEGAFPFRIKDQDDWELVEQKLTWSEEDERICQCLIHEQEKALDDVRNDKYGHSEIISDLKEMYCERIDWLESLKQRIRE